MNAILTECLECSAELDTANAWADFCFDCENQFCIDCQTINCECEL